MLTGYKLTAKGFFSLTLLFFVLFGGLTVILSLWAGARPDPFSPVGDPTIPITPDRTPSQAGNNTPPSPVDTAAPSGTNTSKPPIAETMPPDSERTPGGVADETLTETSRPLAPYPGNGLQLVYPFAGSELSEENKSVLRIFFVSVLSKPGPQSDVLVIEGYAYADEAENDAGVMALADLRMRRVREYCLEMGYDVEILVPVSYGKPPAASAEVVGVSLYFIESSDK